MTGLPAVRRILQIHTRYRQAGGEDVVVDAERRLLEAAGASVEQVIFDNAELHEARSLGSDARLAASAVWSGTAKRRVARAIARYRPQVVHVHNTYAAASPSVYRSATDAHLPVVQTLHNYRLVCPVATCFRDGHACTDCVGRSVAWPAVLHACVRGSRAQSAVVATTLGVHRALGTYRNEVDAYIALTSFQRSLMVQGGLAAARIRVIPNFLEPDPGSSNEPRAGLLYVGRLAQEKGIEALTLAAGKEPGILRVAGDGPLAHLIDRSDAAGDLRRLGRLDAASVLGEVRSALALVLPSIWFEGFPMVVLEAFASGTPVIASRIGSLAEVVDEGETGLYVEPGDPESLAERMRWAADHPHEMMTMGAKARARYETTYQGAGHLAALMRTYEEVIARGPRDG